MPNPGQVRSPRLRLGPLGFGAILATCVAVTVQVGLSAMSTLRQLQAINANLQAMTEQVASLRTEQEAVRQRLDKPTTDLELRMGAVETRLDALGIPR